MPTTRKETGEERELRLTRTDRQGRVSRRPSGGLWDKIREKLRPRPERRSGTGPPRKIDRRTPKGQRNHRRPVPAVCPEKALHDHLARYTTFRGRAALTTPPNRWWAHTGPR